MAAIQLATDWPSLQRSWRLLAAPTTRGPSAASRGVYSMAARLVTMAAYQATWALWVGVVRRPGASAHGPLAS